ncbi:hypothetical protein [Chryseobacterium salivictor]|uniref:Uncharacterized protein n=1 Tax=Chryseobacterium salivictor TaxID=2547600 RepID=A0A4P6ZCC5_9FLAO|nr:hypothetical protein [Chryseobacterium salivictor]QBO57055.1 hypothetical protein NBC122_00197 [Chryseobacterium salivictor]
MKSKPYKIIYFFTILLSYCKNSNIEENVKLNQIISPIVDNERRFSTSLVYITDSLKQLKVYVPTKDEIEQRIPPPPPGKTTNIIHLLEFKKNYTKKDSLELLKQAEYYLKTIKLDSKINKNLKVISSKLIDNRETHLSFSTPLYFSDDFVYIEVGFYDHGFSRGTGYLLKNEGNSWKIVDQRPLWIS